MTNSDLVLNIAVNLSRLGRWSHESKTSRIPQFIADTETYIEQLTSPAEKFTSTHTNFLKAFAWLKSNPPEMIDWSDTAYTWATILTHRAKLA